MHPAPKPYKYPLIPMTEKQLAAFRRRTTRRCDCRKKRIDKILNRVLHNWF